MQCKSLLLLAVVALTLLSAQVSAAPADSDFVRRLYTTLGLAVNSTSANPCTFDGVTCSTDATVPGEDLYAINLAGRDLASQFLPDAQGARLITEINLSGNRRIRARMPDSWSSMTYLKKIDVSTTGAYGSIPDAWNGMARLEEAKMNNCYFCYSMPNWNYSAMPNLRSADFSDNRLRFFSSAFGSFSAAPSFQLNLRNNEFCSCVNTALWTSATLRDAAEAARPGATSTTCDGRSCRNQGRCLPGNSASVLGRAAMAVPAIVVALLVLLSVY